MINFISIQGITSISTYIHAKEIGIVVCQVFCFQLSISSKKKEYFDKQINKTGYHPDLHAKKLAPH
jgi:hypothetical protein